MTFEADRLSVFVDKHQILREVSFRLPRRALLAVIGPSGAGKSTLVDAVTGFRPADTGSVRYAGRDMYTDYDELRRRIGYVPQSDILHVSLTVRQALEYGARLRSRQTRRPMNGGPGSTTYWPSLGWPVRPNPTPTSRVARAGTRARA